MSFGKQLSITHPLFWLLAFLIISTSTRASFEDLGVGARAIAMGEAFVGLANASDAIFMNPAGISTLRGYEISVFYARPFGLKELAYQTLACTWPTPYFNPAIGIQTFGYSVYRETVFNFTCAHHYQRKIFYGLNCRYMTLAIQNYGSTGTLGLDFGMLVQTSPLFSFGFVAKNFNRPRIGQHQEYLPQIFSSGIMIHPFNKLVLTFDIYKDIHFPIEPRAGIEYQLFDYLALRAGTALEPARFSLGFGLRLKSCEINYAFYSHQTLNLTHQISLVFSSSKNIGARPGSVTPLVEEPLPEQFLSDTTSAPPKKTSTARSRAQPRRTKKPSPRKQALKKPTKLKPGETININTASLAELMRLPGIGQKTAAAIIEYRTQKGPFKVVTELIQIKGIGTKKLNKIRPLIRLAD